MLCRIGVPLIECQLVRAFFDMHAVAPDPNSDSTAPDAKRAIATRGFGWIDVAFDAQLDRAAMAG